MSTHLFWHLATYCRQGGGFMEPPHHDLIGIAGIEVTKKHKAKIWSTVGDTKDILLKLDTAVARAHAVTTFTGTNFGFPVVVSNALKHNVVIGNVVQKIDSETIAHADLARELQMLVNPSGFIGFDLLSHLCGLPARPDLDVISAWEAKKIKVIARRLRFDVMMIALGHAQIQRCTEAWSPDHTDKFVSAVLHTCKNKDPKTASAFAYLDPTGS